MGVDYYLHADEGGINRRGIHAHGMGAVGVDVCNFDTAAVFAGAGGVDGAGGGLHFGDEIVLF